MELWDLYDEKRKPLGRTHERGKPLQEGEYYLAVDVWVVTLEGEILVIKKESKEKHIEKWGNINGTVNKGETSKGCAVRELNNMGVQATASELSYLGLVVASECLVDTYLLVKNVNIDELILGKENASEAKLIKDNVIELMHQSELLEKDIWERYEKYSHAMLAHTRLTIEKAKLSFAEEMVNTKANAFRIEIELYGKDPFAKPPVENEKQSTDNKEIKNFAYVMRELEDNKIVGGAYGTVIDEQEICVKCIFMMEKYQNKELGTLLINYLEKEFQEVRIWKTYVPYKSWRQQHFFEKMGYIRVGESEPEADGFCFLYYEKKVDLKTEAEVNLEKKVPNIPEKTPEAEPKIEKEESIKVSNESKNENIVNDKEDEMEEETTAQTSTLLDGFTTVVREEPAIKRKVHYFEMRKNVWREVLDKE